MIPDLGRSPVVPWKSIKPLPEFVGIGLSPEESVMLTLWKQGKDTYDIAKSFGVHESQMFNRRIYAFRQLAKERRGLL